MNHKNRRKGQNFRVLSTRCSLLRASKHQLLQIFFYFSGSGSGSIEYGSNPDMDILYGGIGISK